MSLWQKLCKAKKACMAVFRDNPYGGFNFLVNLGGASGDGSPGTIVGGDFEVTLPTAEMELTDYRAGNERAASPRKTTGLTRYSNVTLRRGLVGSTDLWEWFKHVRDGEQDRRSVAVTLLDEGHRPVMTWKLTNCLPIKYTGPTLNARGSEVAIEEIVLSVERLEIE